jgi:hypothetical protein
MGPFMLNKKFLIESASGADVISYRIMKGAGKESMTFVQRLIKACT